MAFSQTTYFVAMNGSDGADGSDTNPLATSQRALDLAVKPGDTVLMRPGHFNWRRTHQRLVGRYATMHQARIFRGAYAKVMASVMSVRLNSLRRSKWEASLTAFTKLARCIAVR